MPIIPARFPTDQDRLAQGVISARVLHLAVSSARCKYYGSAVTLFSMALSVLYYFAIGNNEQYIWFAILAAIGCLFLSGYWAYVDLFYYGTQIAICLQKKGEQACVSKLIDQDQDSRLASSLNAYAMMLLLQLLAFITAIGLAISLSWKGWIMAVAVGVAPWAIVLSYTRNILYRRFHDLCYRE